MFKFNPWNIGYEFLNANGNGLSNIPKWGIDVGNVTQLRPSGVFFLNNLIRDDSYNSPKAWIIKLATSFKRKKFAR